MVVCSKCKKRPAVLFITKLEGGEAKHEGLCITCARSLGIKQIDDAIKSTGLSDEDLERMDSDIQDFMDSIGGIENLPDNLPLRWRVNARRSR